VLNRLFLSFFKELDELAFVGLTRIYLVKLWTHLLCYQVSTFVPLCVCMAFGTYRSYRRGDDVSGRSFGKSNRFYTRK